MTEYELTNWAAAEHKTRMADLAAVKNGTMTLVTAQQNAEARRLEADLSRSEAGHAIMRAGRERRRTP